MDINVLVLNVGNTRLAIGAFVAGEMKYSRRLSHDQRNDFVGVIAEAWKEFGGDAEVEVAGACVNTTLKEVVEHAVHQATGKNVEWVGDDLDLPIVVKTDEPKQTGVDRILNIAAAYEQMQTACVVVDAGTAITIDVCNDKGEFLGGAIAPGAATMLKSLNEKTAKLPLVTLAAPEGLIGKNTQEAIRQGVFHGIRGMVKEIVENYATELNSWPDIICTGGDARTLFEGWELIHAISPDLTLYGIALAYAEHHIKNGG